MPFRSDGSGGFFLLVLRFFDGHIAELAGVEDFSAIEALDVFGIVFTRDNADSRVFARHFHWVTGAHREWVWGRLYPQGHNCQQRT